MARATAGIRDTLGRLGERWTERLLSGLPVLVLLLGAALLGGGAYVATASVERERAEALRTAERDAANLARTFEEHIHQTIRRIDQALIHLREAFEEDPVAFFPRAAAWQRSLYADLAFQVAGSDAAGRLRFSNLAPPPQPVSLADREHFLVHRDAASGPGGSVRDALFISKPVLGRVSGKWSIQFSRPLRGPGGAFDGILVLSVDPDQLSAFYRSIDIGREGVVSLVGLDRVIRARASGVEAPVSPIGFVLPDRPFFDPAGPVAGSHRIASAVDGRRRIGAYRRLDDYPLVVLVMLGEAEVLAGFEARRQEVLAGGAAAAAFVLLAVLLVAWLAQRQIRHRHRLEAAQRQLVETEERWRLALEAVGDGVWDWNPATGDVFFSSGWKSMLGYADHEIANRLAEREDRIHPDDREAVGAALARHVAGATPLYSSEHRVRRKDGSYTWILDRAILVRRAGDGTPLRVVGTHTDIGARKTAERALEAKTAELERSNAELEAFAYAASHDLRQPLRTIGGYLVLLEQDLADRLDAETRSHLAFARDGARRMDRLIVDLLEFSRVGRRTRPFAPCPAGALVEAALQALEAAIADAAATVTVDPGLPTLWGDEGELVRLFQNLIGNAVKYRAPDRPPVLRVACAAAEPTAGAAAGAWLFTVCDNGIGIAPEHRERVFGLFQRLHRRDAYEGTGIGLALCRKIVERHGGRIWVEEAAGGGCAVRFTLPRRDPPGPGAEALVGAVDPVEPTP